MVAVCGSRFVTNRLPSGDGQVTIGNAGENVNKFVAYQLAIVRLRHRVAIELDQTEFFVTKFYALPEQIYCSCISARV